MEEIDIDNKKDLSYKVTNIQPTDVEHTYYHCKAKINSHLINEKQMGNKVLDRQYIRILTYNLFLRPPVIKNNDNDWKDERLEDFLKLIHNYDIICLQEVFGTYNGRKSQLIRAATKNGFFFYLDPDSPSFYSKYISDGGICILSRFPIKEYAFHAFRYGVLADSIAEKGIIYAKIEIGNSFLHLFTSHTQASYTNDLPELFLASFNTRIDQLKQIGNFIKEILIKNYDDIQDLCILCGDLNVDSLKYRKNRQKLVLFLILGKKSSYIGIS